MKMNCIHCAETIACDCPEGNPDHDPKTARCDVCKVLLDQGVKESELKTSPERENIKRQVDGFKFADAMSRELTKNVFEEFWGKVKGEWRELSKKELAQACYEAGAHAALRMVTQMNSDPERREPVQKSALEKEREGKP